MSAENNGVLTSGEEKHKRYSPMKKSSFSAQLKKSTY
jgi:hypothetical protein